MHAYVVLGHVPEVGLAKSKSDKKKNSGDANVNDGDQTGKQPGKSIFWVQGAWLLIALAVLLVWVSDIDYWIFDGQETQILGIPLFTLWFGALGGILSFWFLWARDPTTVTSSSVWTYSDDFYWHFRPIVTALTGFVGCVIVSLGGDIAFQGESKLSGISAAAIAFSVGFVPKSFPDLVTKMAESVKSKA